jgi:formiminotetrahydrofolate cyclodeaminase
LSQPTLAGVTIEGYLEALASSAPAPGGGSAATLVGAAGAALAAMVARICLRNPAYAPHGELAAEIVEKADDLRKDFLEARRRDEVAFGRVVAAQALPKGTAAERAARRDALELALGHAATEPLRAARLCLEVLILGLRLLEIPNRDLASDAGCAAEFGYAALAACAYNVRVNHRFMHDTDAIASHEHQLKQYESEAGSILDTVRSVVKDRLARKN